VRARMEGRSSALGILAGGRSASTGDRRIDERHSPGEIAAGMEPAHQGGKVATLAEGLAHDVSILPGVGRHLGSHPRAKTSMTIMRAAGAGMGGAARAARPA
jgi:hypothetical protein